MCAWEYNLDVEILVLGSVHYYHYDVCIFKADGNFNSRCPLTRDYKGCLAGLLPSPWRKVHSPGRGKTLLGL